MLALFASTLGGARITLTGQGITDFTLSPTDALATLTIKSNGTYSKTTSSGETTLGNWVEPPTAASQFEVQATEVSGSLDAGVVGSYISPTQLWYILQSSLGSKACTLRIEVRRVGGSVAIATEDFVLTAEKET